MIGNNSTTWEMTMDNFTAKETECIEKSKKTWKFFTWGTLIGSIFNFCLIMGLYFNGSLVLPFTSIFILASFLLFFFPIEIKILQPMFNKRKFIVNIEQQNDFVTLTILTNILNDPKRETIQLNKKDCEVVKVSKAENMLKDKKGNHYTLDEDMANLFNGKSPKKENTAFIEVK